MRTQWDNHAEYSAYKAKGGRGECGYNTNYLVIVARVSSRMRKCHPTFLPYIPLDPLCVGQGMVRLSKRQRKKYRKQYYTANKNEALEQKKANYKFNADSRKETDKQRYRQISEEKICC